MIHIDLPEPHVRSLPLRFNQFRYKLKSKEYLPIPRTARHRGFFETLESRATRRKFKALRQPALSELLWYSAKALATFTLPNGLRIQHRHTPSAGGIHPIDILTVDPVDARISLYDPIAHALCAVCDIKTRYAVRLLQKTQTLVPIQRASVLWFVAEFAKTLSKYKNGESLVWRDAGALLATVCLVSEALQLNCCPIGITGEPFISAALNSSARVVGVGGCLVGGRD